LQLLAPVLVCHVPPPRPLQVHRTLFASHPRYWRERSPPRRYRLSLGPDADRRHDGPALTHQVFEGFLPAYVHGERWFRGATQ
ncbi:hypothetical protein BJV78DRAFT_1355415, partial [Lactifluus subvellereus]